MAFYIKQKSGIISLIDINKVTIDTGLFDVKFQNNLDQKKLMV